VIFRQVRDPWKQALALAHLSTALEQWGDAEGARERRCESLDILAPFADAPAAALKATLTSALGED
jgi:hypothetical protein